MRILIIGASGLVGSHCLEVFGKGQCTVKGTHVHYATAGTFFLNPSAQQLAEVETVREFKPEVIIHCGALTNVDYCENNEQDSYDSTILSVKNVADYCLKNGVKLVYISTDYVFDGTKGPYREDAPVNPINIYGRHKLMAEEIVSGLPDFIIGRVTNVYGEEERAKNFIERLIFWICNNENKQLVLPNDQFATPIYAGDIARMCLLLVKDGKKGIYHLSSTDYYSRLHLAKKVKSYFPDNTSVEITGTDTKTLNQPARRPLLGGMINVKFLDEYPDFVLTNVDEYILKKIKVISS
jgi:dTDP-4-dehydrorhamnose reductase